MQLTYFHAGFNMSHIKLVYFMQNPDLGGRNPMFYTSTHSSPFSSILHKDKKVLGLRNASFPKQEGQGISIVLGENVFKYNDKK